jgi:DNA repair protein RadC
MTGGEQHHEHEPHRERDPHDDAAPGLGRAALCAACAGEEARMFRPGSPENRPLLTSPEAAAAFLLPMLQGLDREHCLLTSVDIKHRVLAVTTVSIGSDGHTFMAPREIFRDALAHGASAVILAHNHPSGDPEPSRDDELVTRRLHRAGELLGIEVLDHLVIGADIWVSLARRGALA